eukprot:5675123-Pyramimonas_sp.AAC.1
MSTQRLRSHASCAHVGTPLTRALPGLLRGDWRVSRGLHAALRPAPRSTVVALPGGQSLARCRPASSPCSAQWTTRAR